MKETRVVKTSDKQKTNSVLRRLFAGTWVSSFSYAAGFAVEFSRKEMREDPLLPLVVRLTLRSDWRIGSADAWHELMSQAPWKVISGEPSDPMRAYCIAWLCGAEIVDLLLEENSELVMITSYGRDLHIEGNDDVFEESWIIDVPDGVPGNEYWSIVCTNRGDVFCRYPATAP